jgi:hypothetical protein
LLCDLNVPAILVVRVDAISSGKDYSSWVPVTEEERYVIQSNIVEYMYSLLKVIEEVFGPNQQIKE